MKDVGYNVMDRNWHLLNQYYVSLYLTDCEISVLEEVISSELQLVVLLVSGTISQKTMSLVSLDEACFNLVGLTGEYHL